MPAPARSAAELELERLAELAFAEARRRSEEALSPDTPPERVAALVIEEFEGLPSPAGLAVRLRSEGSEERASAGPAPSTLLGARKAGKALGRLGDHLVALAERQARQRGRGRDVVVKDAGRDRDDPAPLH